ncbi:MAG: hypothetical protein AABY22_04785, partial [Nanoarchaeota archaeon]
LTGSRASGGAVFAKEAIHALNNDHSEFYIAGSSEGFINMGQDGTSPRCIVLTEEEKEKIRQYQPIKNIIKDADSYDLFVCHHHNYAINTEGIKGKTANWLVGFSEQVNPKIENVLLYSRQYQRPIITRPDTKIYDIVIGIMLPEFKVSKKNNFIFCCHRHWDHFQSIYVAQFAQKYKIKTIFAGRIFDDYPLLKYIDNKYAFYIKEIPDQIKFEYYQAARLTVLCQSWPTPFSLSAIEALSQGCGVACNLDQGFWPTLIQDSINGFHVPSPRNSFGTNEQEFEKHLLRAWTLSPLLNQLTCWQSVNPFDSIRMIRSFSDSFYQILNIK